MNTHPYEYKVLVEYLNPAEKGVSPHFTHESEQTAFTGILNEVFGRLPEAVPEGWEVNSHSIACARDTIVVTVLLRRLVN
jgi:hypothetical protein